MYRKKFVPPGLLLIVLAGLGCQPAREAGYNRPVVPDTFRFTDSTVRTHPLGKDLFLKEPELVALIDEAIGNNPDILMAADRVNVARAHLRFRKGQLLPQVSADAEASAQKYGDYTMEGVGNYDTNLSPNIDDDQKVNQPVVPYFFLGLRSSWEIDLWGRLKSQRTAAMKSLLATREGHRLVITSIVAEIASRYYELKTLDAALKVIEDNIKLQESAVEIAEVQKLAGRTTELGVQQFQAQLLRTRSYYEQTRQNIVRIENEINFLAGRFPQPVVRCSVKDTVPQVHLAGTPQQILDNRPDIRQAELELEASAADVQAAKAALLPALRLTPFAGYSTFNAPAMFDPASIAWGLVGGLSAPVLNRSEGKSRVARSKAEQQLAYHQYFRTVTSAFAEVETTLSNMQHLQGIYRLNLQENEVLQKAVTTSNELYQVGYATYLEVIAAQGNAIEAQLNALETRRNLYHALVTLYRATGGGW